MTTIYFNNQTGSDTLASGAGPSTAITGTAAAHTNGVASTTITLTNNPDLTNVLTNGTHAIWLVTASGRQLSFITAKDNTAKTVTVGDSFTIASGSAVNYAIGGKRRTIMGSTQIFSDLKTNWKYVLENTGTNYVITSSILMTTNVTVCEIQGDSSASLTVVEIQHNGDGFVLGGNGGAQHNFTNLKFISTSATKTTGAAVRTQNARIGIFNCIFGDPINRLYIGLRTTNGCDAFNAWNCAIINCISSGTDLGGGPYTTMIDNCLIANNGGNGHTHATFSGLLKNSVFYNNSGHGYRSNPGTGSQLFYVTNCIFHANTQSAISYGWGGAGSAPFIIVNSIFSNNIVSAIASNSMNPSQKHLLLGNVFFNNGAKYTNLVNPIVQDELNIDPQFVSPSTYDFTVGNPSVKGKSYPQVNPAVQGGTFYNYGTAGAAQPQASGGGGLLLPRAMNGGYSA